MNSTIEVRLLVVDDHEVVRNGICKWLADTCVHVFAQAEDATTAVAQANDQSINCVLLDVRLGELDGLWALERIKAARPKLPVVVFTSYLNPTYVARAAALGATDYLLKETERDTLVHVLRRCVAGEEAEPHSLLVQIREVMKFQKFSPPVLAEYKLTHREIQVLRHVGLGLSNKEIGRSLCISVETVKEHVQNILRKLNAKDRTDAAVRAVRWGLVDQDKTDPQENGSSKNSPPKNGPKVDNR